MSERQLKLKSILNQWSACTMTIEQAEKELGEYFGGHTKSVVPIAYLESDYRLTNQQVERICDEWERLHHGSMRAVILPPGMRYVDANRYQPNSVAAKVGDLAIECNGAIGGDFTIDGEPIRDFTKMVLTIEAGSAPVVAIEYPLMPLAKRAANAD